MDHDQKEEQPKGFDHLINKPKAEPPSEDSPAEVLVLNAENDPFRSATIHVGLPIFVDYLFPGNVRSKGESRLLGWRTGSWILASTPENEGNELHFGYHSRIQVRFVLDGRIFGFNTRQLMDQQEPFGLIFLEYPRELEQYCFREAPRLDLVLACTMESAGTSVRGTIVDISEGGCLVVFDQSPELAESVTLSFTLPTGKIVKGLPGSVCRVKDQGKRVHVGVHFSASDPAQRGLIATYVTMALDLLKSKGG